MSKKFYFASIFSLGTLALGAQCTIDTTVFTGPNDYSIRPDTIINLPIATVGVGYTTDLQFHVQPDTTVTTPFSGTFPIQDVKLDSITGIPLNFSYSTNPSNGDFPGGSYGCAAVTGLATPGQELGGPNSDGVYPVVLHLTATVVVFSVPTPTSFTKTGYMIRIQAANGIMPNPNVSFAVATNAPNPSDKQTEFSFTNPVNGYVQFTLYNILGEPVKQTSIAAVKGDNRYTLNTADLPSGVYLYTFRSGNAVVTRKLTVSH